VKKRRIFVYGAGGHGKVVGDILVSRGESEFAGFVDDREELWGAKVIGFSVFGGGEWVRQEALHSPVAIALGVGEGRSRHLVAERCSRWGIEILTLVHPAATLSQFAQLGSGTIVAAGAIINPDARVGVGAIVNTGAVIEHDVEIGDFAHLAPNASMGGASHLGSFSHLGLGAIVLQGVHVGWHTVVGAGAVVTKSLPDQVVAVGVPARIHRQLEIEGWSPMNVASRK
jgi:sugar O-acyltransferase (sialic acid O-acetyltransferase NeuD family)